MDGECKKGVPGCWLTYDFCYDGIRHKGRVKLDESTSGVRMLYDDHTIEVTWVKRIRHKGKYVELSIVVNDDAYDANEGKVVASAWVCVYSLRKVGRRVPLSQLEPERWSYTDEQNASNNVSKETFYEIGE